MKKFDQPMFGDPGLEGPDYVALVIEWDEAVVREPLEDAVTSPMQVVRPSLSSLLAPFKKPVVAALAGAAVALLGNRLRAA
ncbi:MAG: hypothetical protein WKG01_29935 [Kofleriaceae bacterium]